MTFTRKRWGLLAILSLVLAACTTPKPLPEDLEQAMFDLERRTLDDLAARYPGAREAVDTSVGYAIFSIHSTKVPVVGRGSGLGVAVDRENGDRHYLRLTHVDIGGGLGDTHFRLAVVFLDRRDFERLRGGRLHFSASMDVASRSTDTGRSEKQADDAKPGKRLVRILHDRGAAASWTVRMIRFVPVEP